MKPFLITLFFTGISLLGNACLNYYFSLDSEGHLHPADELYANFKKFDKDFDVEKVEKQLLEIEEKIRAEGNYGDLSDYAVILMKLGKVEESVQILSQLQINYPDEYKIAANLGTAYELSGELDSAMKYINRGMELNPNAHGGSEWVHIKVLETKKELEKDTAYLMSNTVLQLSERDEADSNILYQISIQLHERFPFSPGPDAIMASMVEDLADCYASSKSIEHAKAIYTIAKEYYGNESDDLQKKIDRMVDLRGEYGSIRPERGSDPREGERVVIRGIRYKKLLRTNNESGYEVGWESVFLNTDSLLNFVGITVPEEPELLPEEEIDSTHNSNEIGHDEGEDSKEISSWIYYLTGGLFALGVLILVVRRKK